MNQNSIAHTDEGKGLPVVLIHAFPLNRRMWSLQVSVLRDRFRMITVDLRGHGDSASVPVADSVDDFALDVREVLDRLSIRKAVLVGLSMGGYTAFACYRCFPDRVEALVLSDTRAQSDSAETRAGRVSMIQIAESKGADAIADIMLPRLLSPASLQKPELSESLRAMIKHTPIGTIKADLKAMADRPDSTPLLGTIRCPTLVLVGELDGSTPPSDARFIAQNIPEAHLQVISNAGHLPNIEQPSAFNNTLASFLQTLS